MGEATWTDSCSQHTRVGRRGGHGQRRARSPSVVSGLPYLLSHFGPIPGSTIVPAGSAGLSYLDNAWAYTKNKDLAALLERRQILHKRTRPYRPQTNGKVERLQQTMDREWARGLSYRSSADRRAALPHWLAYYNERRGHSALGNRPPMARVRDVLGHDT